MPLVELKRDASAAETRRFALFALPAFCLLLAAIAGWRFGSATFATVFIAAGAMSIVLSLFAPGLMRGLLLAWLWVTFPVGWLVAHLVLAVIYFLLITPIGLVMRIVGRDPLRKKFDREADSYWMPRKPADESRYFRQF